MVVVRDRGVDAEVDVVVVVVDWVTVETTCVTTFPFGAEMGGVEQIPK